MAVFVKSSSEHFDFRNTKSVIVMMKSDDTSCIHNEDLEVPGMVWCLGCLGD